MYPYNIHRPKTTIIAKERTQTKNPDLSTDRRLQELLQLARQDAARLEEKYHALLNEVTLSTAQDIIRTMEIDSKKHQRILQEALFTIFSDTFEDIFEDIAEGDIPSKDAEALLEELLFTELDDITFYRNLLFAMEDDDLWDLIFEIITDKQNHAAALNHLYAKYFTKTTGQ
ncbi:MAG: hypothetical protein IKT73_04350 [Anaerotignum sp.]|nr:hypothetical protein [Anaerotignum sp.]